jgi:hypothetical protein
VLCLQTACSEAEPPDAYYDGGPRPNFDPAFDAGPGRGNRDQLCTRGQCNAANLVCVAEADGDGGTADYCRLECDLQDNTDPCGVGSKCGRLTDNSGACLPAGAKDEACPCDDGLACTLLPQGDAGEIAICKTICDPDQTGNVDAGPDAGGGGTTNPSCDSDETCRRLAGQNDTGVCVD